MNEIKVNRVEFIKQYAWYLSLIIIDKKRCAFWSYHDRTGLSDEKAKKYFKHDHIKEVLLLIKQKQESECQTLQLQQ